MSDGKDPSHHPAIPAAEISDSAAGSQNPLIGKIEPPILKAVDAPPLAPSIEPVKPDVAAPQPEPVSAAGEAKPAITQKLFALPLGRLPQLPRLSRRARWRGLIAASMAFCAGVGAAIGAITVARNTPPSAAMRDATAAQERDALQKTIQKLNLDISALKASLETSNKATGVQIGKLSEKLKDNEKATEAVRRASLSSPSEVTGSVAQPSHPAAAIPVPTPRPVAAVAPRPAIVEGWSVRSARDGLVLVENRGEIFEVVPGAPLPGLGRVEDIRREDGRWVVVTPKGLIIAASRPPRPVYYNDRY